MRLLLAGNWKMHLTLQEALHLAQSINDYCHAQQITIPVVLCVPFPYLQGVQNQVAPPIYVGAQNVFHESWGAFTGEVSAPMLASLNISYCIVGHSERRKYFNEKGEILKLKILQLLNNNIRPIYCIGEDLTQRERGETLAVLQQQLKEGLEGLTAEQLRRCVLAYEPVWAIGTGKAATEEQVQQAHQFIRNTIAQIWGETVADSLTLLYGGSVKPENAAKLFAIADVDGALVGGASLKAESFLPILNHLIKKKKMHLV